MRTILKYLLAGFFGVSILALGILQIIQMSTIQGLQKSVSDIKADIETLKVTPTETETELTTTPTQKQTMTLKFYVSDLVKDPDVEDCNAPTYVERTLPYSTTPLADSLNYLFKSLRLTNDEQGAGLVNRFEHPDYATRLAKFKLLSATITNNVATITLEDPLDFTGQGSCAGSIIKSQIENTAKQFPSVTTVKFMPDNGTLFQP
jgi:hypothetical protein